MQDDVTVILQNPRFRLPPFDSDARSAAMSLHQLFHFFGDRSHLTATRGCRDNEEIRDRSDRNHLKDEGIFPFEVRAGLRGQAGEFTAGLLTLCERGIRRFRTSSDGNVSKTQQVQKGNRPTSFPK